MTFDELLKHAEALHATDIHLRSGCPPFVRIHGRVEQVSAVPLGAEELTKILSSITTPEDMALLQQRVEVDFAFSTPTGRLRGHGFHYANGIGVALRRLPTVVPTIDELGLPPVVKRIVRSPQGLVLITGATGSGKTTTASSMIDLINRDRAAHIVTIEDPIEVVHVSCRSVVTQREVGLHTATFAHALRGALREDPDVVFVGEMRDLETIDLALKAAETGHLVISTLHTSGAARTISRIIDAFPSGGQNQIRSVLADALVAVVSQELVTTISGKISVLAEILVATPAVRSLIREGRVHQIDNAIQTSSDVGMQSREKALKCLIAKGELSPSIDVQL